jgi:hypothetical protein
MTLNAITIILITGEPKGNHKDTRRRRYSEDGSAVKRLR